MKDFWKNSNPEDGLPWKIGREKQKTVRQYFPSDTEWVSVPGIPMTHVLNKALAVISEALYNTITHRDWKCRKVREETRNKKPYKETLLSAQVRNQAF